jgi:hypothetical protein
VRRDEIQSIDINAAVSGKWCEFPLIECFEVNSFEIAPQTCQLQPLQTFRLKAEK